MIKKVFILFFLIIPNIIFSQEIGTTYSISDYHEASKALITTFFFQGSFFVMALYIILMYIQYKKRDYLYYGVYLIFFIIYSFVRIELVLELDILPLNKSFYSHLILPMLLLTTGFYIKFIAIFANIKAYDEKFNKQVSYFSYLLYSIALITFAISLISGDYKTVTSFRPIIMAPIHVYSLYAIIKTYLVVKSKLRYYVLVSNLLLYVFALIAIFSASQFSFNENLTSHHLLGFYSFNSSQLGSFLELIGFSLGLGYKFSLIEKEKDEITKLSSLKSKLYADISHEFRTPLTLISGPIDSILSSSEFTETELDNFAMIKRNTNRLSSLVNQLLDLEKLDAGSFKLHLLKGNLSLFLRTIAKSFDFEAGKKAITYNVDIFPIENSWYDEDVIEKIATNLLSNAFKYCPKNGTCDFKVSKQEGIIYIDVSNTVDNLNEGELKNLFNRYYQKDEFAEGTGIGLSLVNELVKLCDGKIAVKLEEDNLIHFMVQLPLKDEALVKGQYLEATNGIASATEIKSKEEYLSSENSIEPHDKKELPILLIVEDHDEVRQFIKQSFQANYQIFEAENGKVGIEKAIKIIPDIILSDVRMPICDGIELCNTLKATMLTSHIPIILLTAEIGEENALVGLKSGADDFIEKPFKFRILDAKISNLIEIRNGLRKKFQQDFLLKPINSKIAPTEELFLNKVQVILDKELSNPNFNAEIFAKKMTISRMQLHRKLLAYTSLSTTAFIRSQRLIQAVRILKTSDTTINEVAYLVGFNTPSYFIKCFKETYHKTPTEYFQ